MNKKVKVFEGTLLRLDEYEDDGIFIAKKIIECDKHIGPNHTIGRTCYNCCNTYENIIDILDEENFIGKKVRITIEEIGE